MPRGQRLAAFLLKDPLASEASAIAVLGTVVYPAGNLQIPQPGTKTLNPGNPFNPGQAAIDGFTLIGSKMGGGIFAIAGAHYLSISNNNINGNNGFFAGGIAVGTSDIGFDSQNTWVTIWNNKIHRNGGTDGAGGIAMNEGAHNYQVIGNVVMGNLCRFKGAGHSHDGLSDNALIAGNKFLFNENNFGALLNRAGDGGGIFIGSFGGTAAAGPAAVAMGTGNVTIDGNLIQGNLTGSGNGGGIIAQAVNGIDVQNNPANPALWYRLNIINNIIVNNVAARAGAGIYLEDSVFANIINNTIAYNDSTATSCSCFCSGALTQPPAFRGRLQRKQRCAPRLLDAATVGGPYPIFFKSRFGQ
jgi:hypothetical protein